MTDLDFVAETLLSANDTPKETIELELKHYAGNRSDDGCYLFFHKPFYCVGDAERWADRMGFIITRGQ